jgi:hypothetical protein
MEKNLVRFVVLSVRAGTIGSKMKANKRDDCKIAKIKKLLAEDYGENHVKRQAASGKLANIFSLVKFPVSRDERLYQDKCILRMLHVKRNLMW